MTLATNKTLDGFFTEFSSYLDAHYSRPKEPEKGVIKNGPPRVRRLDSLARLIIKENTLENCAAVALLNDKWYFTANDYAQIKDNIADIIFNGLSRVVRNDEDVIVRTAEARDYLLNEYLKSVTDAPLTLSRLQKDVRKFLSALKTDTIFTKHEIEALLKGYWLP